MKHPSKRILSLLLIAALLCGLLVMPANATDGKPAASVISTEAEKSEPQAVIPSGAEESASPSSQASDDGKIHLDFEQVDDSLIQDDLLARAAFPEEEPLYADTDSVRVSIVLESAPAIDAGFGRATLASSQAAQTYRARLEQEQAAVQAKIESDVLAGQPLDVCWSFTLAANLISANVPYGKLAEIAAVPGVKQVVLETKYEPAVAEKVEESDLNDFPGEGVLEPQMAVSVEMNGATQAWDLGYTGAGTRIAIIDTGLDTDHQSFDPGAWEYAIAEDAAKAGMTPEEYAEAKHFLTVEEIAEFLPQLNAAKRSPEAKAGDFYVNAKAPFGYNYIDQDFDITHDHDRQGEHGSHVAGIASANRYIPQADGTYAVAVDAVKVVGNAPDAQLLVMKVAGKGGGIYESDYFAAIEDAVVLKCDAANLSLGSPMAGFTASDLYQTLLDSLAETDMVVTVSAGNNGAWADNTGPGALYTEDVNFHTGGSPGTYANALTVASVDNDGVVNAFYFLLGEEKIVYQEPGKRSPTHANQRAFFMTEFPNLYWVIPGEGKPEDFEPFIDIYNQIDKNKQFALVQRGGISFSEKAQNAAAAGFGGLIVYNNVPGNFSMDVSGFSGDIATVSISQEAGQKLIEAAQTYSYEYKGESGAVQIGEIQGAGKNNTLTTYYNSEFKIMSSFSSWGVPGDLSLKPEITAPGGSVYSVNGADTSGTAYVAMSGTSMAAPQVAGMTALVMQYIRENNLSQPGVTDRALAQSLLTSTAEPLAEKVSMNKPVYYSLLQQGAGLAAVDKAVNAPCYIVMDENATSEWKDGKIKAELGDSPDMTKFSREFTFTIRDLSGETHTYYLDGQGFTQNYDTANGQTLSQTKNCALQFRFTDPEGISHQQGLTVTVPANGSIQLTVFASINNTRVLKNNFPNGTYIQGLVMIHPVDGWDEEVEGSMNKAPVLHNIPMLAFFGDWSSSSMYDKGCWQIYRSFESAEAIAEAGLKQYYVPALSLANTLLSRKAGQTGLYYVGGNPAFASAEYDPERNAWNNAERSTIDSMAMTFIRNAAATRVTVKNADTGEILLQKDTGPANAAFYYPNAGGWYNTNTKLPLKFRGEGLEDGTRLEFICQAATEYAVQPDGSVAWDSLGAGSVFRVPLRIDNTDPELFDVTLDEATQLLTFTAKDNHWLAGALLCSSGGNKQLAAAEAAQEEEGTPASFTMDLSQVNGQRFLLAVMDYAGNTATYRLFRGADDDEYRIPHGALAFEHTTGLMVSFDVGNTNGDMTPFNTMEAICVPDVEFCSAAEAKGILYLTATDGWLYAMNKENVAEILPVADLGMILADLCYDPLTDQLYGVRDMDFVTSAESTVYSLNLATLQIEKVGTLPFPANTITCDDKGNFYTVVFGKWQMGYNFEVDEGSQLTGTLYGTGSLYRFRLDAIDTPELVVPFWKPHDGLQSLAWNPSSNSVFWANYYKYIAMDAMEVIQDDLYEFYQKEDGTWEYRSQRITNGNTSNLDVRDVHLSALVFPDPAQPSGWPEGEAEVEAVSLPESLELVPGEERLLQAAVTPWWVTDGSVTWSSADPSVASVNAKGLVTANSLGETTVTAVSVLDPSKQATAVIRVARPEVLLKGVLTGDDGQQSAFLWDLSAEDTYCQTGTLSRTVSAVALNREGEELFGSGQEKNESGAYDIFTMDPGGLTVIDVSQKDLPIPLHGLAYLPEISGNSYRSTVMGFNGSRIMLPIYVLDPEPEYQDFYEVLAQTSGAARFVAMAHGGVEAYVSNKITADRADLIYLLDDTGAVWKTHILDLRDENGQHVVYYFDIQNQSGMWDPILTDLMCDLDAGEARSNVSMLCDETTGDLYVSSWNGKDTELYRLRYSETKHYYVSTLLGVMEGVGPVSLYDGTVLRNTDKTALEAAIAEAEGIDDLTVYTEESAAAFAAALVAAEAVYDDPAATQEEVDAATEALLAAIAGLTEKQSFLFDDVQDESKYYFKPVYWAYNHDPQITAGTSDKTFGIKDFCTRAQIVTFLYAAYGKPEVQSDENPFTDVKEGKYYYKAVLWALENGISTGKTETTFGVKDPCTRAQAVTFLWKAAGSPEPKSTENPFTDVEPGKYYYKAVLWAVENGITSGTSATTFGVKNTCTRAQIVTFLYKALVND